MSEHTPGKWEDRGYIQNGRRIIASVKTGYNICEIYVGESEDAESEPIKSNARLIASAPEMYEALKIMTALVRLKYGNLDKGVWEKVQKVEALLTRIEGEK